MAHAIMFDTLYYANKLKTAGVPAQQAEVQAETLGEIFDESEQHLASKDDLKMAKVDLTTIIENLAREMLVRFATVDTRFAEIKTEMAETRTELIKWVIGIGLGQAALIISLLKFLH